VITYPVYLETTDDGRCMAHVLDLPGCFARGQSRMEALQALPGAIQEYYAWLRRHGELPPSGGERFGVKVAGESKGCAPFEPGDAAALFPPERKPITLEEMEYYFRLMSHARTDLLAIVRNLPSDVLDWQSDAGSLSIRKLLRHVGNAEKWYVSRVVPLEGLPAEWEDDEEMPVLEYLEMVRRTAIARLRQLNENERSSVFHPAYWTRHPEEAWTARKVLRRFLEHEREHTAQAVEILKALRQRLLVQLDAERAVLLQQLEGLDEKTLIGVPVMDDWTVRDILAHIAAWDRWELQEMKHMLAGHPPDLTAVRDVDSFNEVIVAMWRERALAEVLDEMNEARAQWVDWMKKVPVVEFFRQRMFGGQDWSFMNCVQVQLQHDREHAAQIKLWKTKHLE